MGLRLLSTSVVQNNVVIFVCLPGGDEVVVVWLVEKLQNKEKVQRMAFLIMLPKSSMKSIEVAKGSMAQQMMYRKLSFRPKCDSCKVSKYHHQLYNLKLLVTT